MKISIVIPVYNEQEFLAHCLDSIMNQSVKPSEVIVVDNNSSDRSLEIVRKYPKVRVVHERQQGIFYARNLGFDQARGDLLVRIDADTILPQHYIKTVIKIFNEHNYDAVTGSIAYYDCLWPKLSYKIDGLIRSSLAHLLNRSMFLYGSNMVIKKEAYLKIKFKLHADQSFHEDIDLALCCQKNKLLVGYDQSLLALISSRRFSTNFKDFFVYMRATPRTYLAHHDKKGYYFYLIMFFALVFYFLIRLDSLPSHKNNFTYKLINPIKTSD